jgi:hypothetical protein
MKVVYTFHDDHTGNIYVVIPKIREVQTALGSLVITFDNGDRRTFETGNLKQTLDELIGDIEAYYNA